MKYIINTDASLNNEKTNPGYGYYGWAGVIRLYPETLLDKFYLLFKKNKIYLTGRGNKETFKNISNLPFTSTTLEFIAVINVLNYLPKNSTINIITDERTIGAFHTEYKRWSNINFKNKRGKTIKVKQQMLELQKHILRHKNVTFKHIRRENNQEADWLAVGARCDINI